MIIAITFFFGAIAIVVASRTSYREMVALIDNKEVR